MKAFIVTMGMPYERSKIFHVAASNEKEAEQFIKDHEDTSGYDVNADEIGNVTVNDNITSAQYL